MSWGERGSCPQTNSTQSCSNADSTGAGGCDGENRSKTDIELALIRKAESENTINSDTNKQGNAWART